MRAVLFALVLSTGCISSSDDPTQLAPYVHITGDLPGTTGQTLRAARAWAPLGYRVTTSEPPSPLPECPRHWYRGDSPDCVVSVYVIDDPNLLTIEGVTAKSDRTGRTVWIDSSLTQRDDHALDVAVAHEFGHILLDTPRHTSGGIMGGSVWVMRAVDYELACETIGVCEEP